MTKNEKELAEINCSYQYEGGYHDGYEAAMATIVRCKDCVYYQRASTQNDIRFYIPEGETILTDLALYVGNIYVRYERIKSCTFRFEILTDDEDEARVVVQKIIDQMIADHDDAPHGVTWETISLETVPQEGRFNISTIFDWKYRVRDSY